MDKIFREHEIKNCDNLAQAFEQEISGCEVTNLGNCVLLNFDNKSVCTVYPLSAGIVDIFCKTVDDKQHDLKDVTVEKCLDFLRTVAALTEETSTGSVAGYDGARAFAAPGQKINRGTEASEKMGWQRIGEGRKKSRLSEPFGRDPLGAKERRSISEVSGSSDAPQVLEYLAEMLPVDSAEIIGGELVLRIAAVEIRIVSGASENFSIQSFVDGEPVQANDNVTAGNLVRWAFEIVGKIQSRAANKDDSGNDMEISNDDIWGTIKELARGTGKSDDILRNPDLFSLRQGLCVARSPFENAGRRFFGDDFINETSGSQVSSSLQGATMHDGKPVSVNESRDISRPYADTLGGKKLVYLPGAGATLICKSQLPKKLKLNFDPHSGQVIFTDESVPTCKAGMWKFFGRA